MGKDLHPLHGGERGPFCQDSRPSASGREIPSDPPMTLRSIIAITLFIPAVGLSACVSVPPTRSIYTTPGMSDAEWSRIRDECSYEAEKATASADPMTATSYTQRRLFTMCAELKGATFAGRVTMPNAQWDRIETLCKEEAANAVAGQPPSRGRDERKEDAEIECAKRNGAVFQQSLYP